ncbi:MAG: hypothetical protein RR796_04245 [Victivallaceae bacterium]
MISCLSSVCYSIQDMNQRIFVICAIGDILLFPLNSVLTTVFTFIALCTTIIAVLIKYSVHIFRYDRCCKSCISGECYAMFRGGLSISNFQHIGYLNLIPILGPCIVTCILFYRGMRHGAYSNSLRTLGCSSSFGSILYLAFSETLELPLAAVSSIPSFKQDLIVI